MRVNIQRKRLFAHSHSSEDAGRFECMHAPGARRGTGLHAAGFTLLEILIALVVFSIVLLAVNSIFYGALRLRNKTNESVTRAVEIDHALKVIKKDLANILPSGGTMTGSLQTESVGGIGGASSPVLYTASGSIDQTSPFGNVQKVSYTVGSGGLGYSGGTSGNSRPVSSGGGGDLYRNVSRNLLPQTQEDISSELLLSGVQSLTFEFYDGRQWRPSWDSTTETTPMPVAIKVQLILADQSNGRFAPDPIELIAPVMVTGSTNQTSSTTSGGGAQ
jgi:general secretion pathway protein J